ncbi:SDR family oxidoreductase [Haemophilus paraphrohaemolyticus]|uniref:KR domain protein n=1 Tax=Haemophilus paraphrohaemolyticus HK411 TaxID=1095743 RepID=I2NFR2_9PAST|nr:SDR family oxidoreductase [Haemophilus paraphrohaemolyticus]EIG24673.1 KR domain protein [Haemophilus paraphrohaemolyticus HK411]OOR93776.1 NAD(P)-dependent oxidoreductase [Haemophilus paraphrohaemolyticus]STP01951.1 NADP-dependent 3-hydroxy acid dehydrogenase YdfG [Haemophilus paraphrohaemolyticus]
MRTTTALVTGATAGFGLAICKKLIEAGYKVIGTGRRAARLAELHSQLGNDFLPLTFDITDLEATKQALNQRPEGWQAVDLLVNNAGLALGLEPAHQADLNDWAQMIDTNVKGLVNITRLVLPEMVDRNHGHIINLSSIAGNYPYPGGNVYGGTKAFVTQFSLNLRADLAGTKIRVSNVEPGLCGGTEFSNVRFHGDDEKAAKVYENVQSVQPEDIANIVLWLNQQPEHVNINRIEVMPTAQSFNPLKVTKENE